MCRFWQIFVKALEVFTIVIIQSRNSASTHEYSENNCASKYVMLLSNFGKENRGLSPVSEAGFRHQLVLVPPTNLAPWERSYIYHRLGFLFHKFVNVGPIGVTMF